ncbi:unnamed protein product [Effrenium voratum]|nr:unnamed protein product [Effrenium voratum]
MPCSLLSVAVFGGLCAAALSPLHLYSFQADPVVEAVFEATSSPVVLSGRSPSECDESLDFTGANASSVALAIFPKGGQPCWTTKDARYSHSDFPIVLGVVRIGEQSLDAFEIQPPQSQASAFAASGQQVYVLLPGDALEYKLYRLKEALLIPHVTVQAGNMQGFVPTGVHVEELSMAEVYVVVRADQPPPGPTRRTMSGHGLTECEAGSSAALLEANTFGDIALVTMKRISDGKCWNSGEYANSDFVLESGRVTGSDGVVLDAFRVSPPSKTATAFVASHINLYVRQATQDITIWALQASGLRPLDTVKVEAGNHSKTNVRVDDLAVRVDGLAGPLIVILQPSSAHITTWPEEALNVEAAWLDGDGSYSLTARRFRVEGQPFVPLRQWAHGPSSSNCLYGDYKRFFPVKDAAREGIVWQDFDSNSVKLTWLAADLLSSQTISLTALSSTAILVGAVGDGLGTIVLLLGSNEEPADQKANAPGELVKFDSAGSELQRVPFPSQDLGLWSFFQSGASLAWHVSSGTIAMSVAMQWVDGGDGVNHQGTTNIIFNATTLQKVRTSAAASHSWANSLHVSEKEDFYLGMDLGDAYPRGIQVWELEASSSGKQHRVVYRNKILHRSSDTTLSGKVVPVYEEISTATQTFYQWSKNDNAVYTELAHPGLHELDDAVLVFFAGEAPPLDGSAVGKLLNVARNVGFVKIPRDLSNSSVLSPGENEDGGYYSEEGIWQARSNRGVSFLTSKADLAESVSRLKTAHLGGSILLLWEVWSDVHQRNEFMIVNAQGEPELAEAALAFPFNLPFADDLLIVNGKAVAYVGDPANWLVRFEFCYQDCDPPRSSGSSTSSDGGSTTLAAEASFSTREAGGLKVLLFALAGGLSGS